MTSFKPVTAVFPNGLFIDGARADARLDGRVTGATLIRAYDSATRIELDLWDDDFEILTGGLLDRRGKVRQKDFAAAAWSRVGVAQVPVDGFMFRLAGYQGSFGEAGHSLTVAVEDEIGPLMRQHKGALHVSRKDNTRAEFIGLMAAEVKEIRVRYRSPEQGIAQHIKDDKAKANAQKERKRSIGRAKVTIKGAVASKQQRRNLDIALNEADRLQAGDRATLGMLVTGIGESSFMAVPNAGGSNYWGVFQASKSVFKLGDTAGMADSFLSGGKGFQGGGAIKLAAQNPTWTPGQIALTVEGSRSNFASDAAAIGFYQQWAKEAEAILAAYGGIGHIAVVRHGYSFRRAKREDSWAASDRLAQEVRWRRFADRNVLWYVSDEWLFGREPVLHIEKGNQARFVVWHNDLAHTLLGVSNYSADVGRIVSEMQLTVILDDRWAGGPGAVVVLDDLGPLNGRWLIYQHQLDMFSGESTIIIRRPQPKLPEPAANRDVSVLTESRPEAGSPRQRIVAAAKKAFGLRQFYRYEQKRPMPDSLFPSFIDGLHVTPGGLGHGVGASVTLPIDCSAFVTLVYKAAGIVDPNGRGYDGGGNTSTLRANGTKTTDPQPGDLIHFGSGAPGNASHVNIYIGGGEVLNMGGAGLTKLKLSDVKAWSSPRFAGIYTYDLTDQGF